MNTHFHTESQGCGIGRTRGLARIAGLCLYFLNLAFGAVAAPEAVYVALAEDFAIEADNDGSSTLSAGDTVGWQSKNQGAATGLEFGFDAFVSPIEALAAVAPGGVVRFAGGTYFPGETLLIEKRVTLIGDGAQSTRLSGNGEHPVVVVESSQAVTLRDLTIADGYTWSDSGSGLIVRENARANLLFCEVTGSRGMPAVYSEGQLRIAHSTIRNNDVDAVHAMAWEGSTSEMWIDNSTIHSNEGIGVFAWGRVWIRSSTIALNITYDGNRGGILSVPSPYGGRMGEVHLFNSAVVGNGSQFPLDLSGKVIARHSLIGAIGDSDGIEDGIDGNIIAADENGVIPVHTLLEPLSLSFGGQTMTAPPAFGSPLLHAGSIEHLPADIFDLDGDGDTVEPVPCDQRGEGFSRVTDGAVSIGAVNTHRWTVLVDEVYVAEPEAFILDEDNDGDSVLSAGDTVTWQSENQGTVSGLVLGESAFLSPAAAVEAVAPGGTVRIASGTYLPTHSVPGKHEIHIRNDVTLIGDGAQNTYLDGNDIGLLILVDAGAAATIRDLTLTRAFDYDDLADGSALQVGESAQATLAFCEVTHSYGFGIISSEGNLRILHSTIRHNRSTAIRSNGASAELRIDNSTIHSNERTGVSIESSAWIRNSTIAGNSLGGISCEYSDNVNLHNSVVAGNVSWGSAPQEIVGQIHAAGFNAIGDPATSGGIVDGENGNIVGIEGTDTAAYSDWLGDLTLINGGWTMTAAPVSGSPLLQAGSADFIPTDLLDLDGDDDTEEPVPYDQRGEGFPRVSESVVSIGAVDAPMPDTVYVGTADSFTIETDRGASGLSFGDTVTWQSESQGPVSGLRFGSDALLSLAEALQAVPTGGTIRIASGVYMPDHPVTIAKDVTLVGDGAQNTFVDGNGEHDFLLTVGEDVTAIVRDLTLTGGGIGGAVMVSDDAEGIFAFCEITGSTGAGVVSDGRFRLLNSTIWGNDGGGVIVNFAEVETWVENSTIHSNKGNGIQVRRGSAWIRNSTIAQNTGVGVRKENASTEVHLWNTAVVDNGAGISGTMASAHHSLVSVSDWTGGLVDGENGNIVGIGGEDEIAYEDLLEPLSLAYGGQTRTAPPVFGSRLLEAGSAAHRPSDFLDFDGNGVTEEPIPYDQRGEGFSRVWGASVSIGAVDTHKWHDAMRDVYVAMPSGFTIDVDTGDPGLSLGDQVTWLSMNQGTVSGLVFGINAFRTPTEALEAVTAGGTIRIASGMYGTNFAGVGMDIAKDVTIAGDGAQITHLNGGGKFNGVWVQDAADVIIRDLTIADIQDLSETTPGHALTVADPDARVTLAFCEIINSGDSRSAAVVSSIGKLRILNSTIRENVAGAIRIDDSRSETWIGNSTIYSNGGRGILVEDGSGPVRIYNSTIAGNSDYGIYQAASGDVRLYNTAVAGNFSHVTPNDIYGSLQAAYHSLIGDAATAGGIEDGVNGNIVGIDGEGTIPYASLFGPLSISNGGTTRTAAPVAGSPLLQAGAAEYIPTDFLDLDGDGDTEEPIPYDQRGQGFPRVWASRVSIGAVDAPRWRGLMERVYVAAAEDFEIEIDAGDPGLTFGDTVAFGDVSGLVYGMDATTTLAEALDAAAPGGTIYLPAGRLLPGETIVIDKDLTLIGKGARTTFIDGNGGHRIIDVTGNANVDFHHLTLTGGRSPDDDPGGAALRISADAHVRMGYCEITDSRGESAVSAEGRFRFLSGTIRDNQGTAIRADATTAGRVWFDNSTMFGNHGSGAAGGIQFSGGQVWVRNSSVVLNTSSPGSPAGGIARTDSGQLHLRNSVVAGNTIEETPADIAGEVNVSNFIRNSLIGDAATSGGVVDGDNGNIVGIGGEGTLPYTQLLGAPAFLYGGPTMTVAPVPGSPLLAAGIVSQLPPDNLDFDSDENTAEGIPYDQRGEGFLRVSEDETVSIGAVETAMTAVAYVALADDFIIESDNGDPGLGAGDIVTWQSVNQGTASGLVFGENAFASLPSAVEGVVAGGTIRIAAGTYTSGQHIDIRKDITLIGDGAQYTILDEKRENLGIRVIGPSSATILHLTITNANHPVLHFPGAALTVSDGAQAILAFCEITNSGDMGQPGIGSDGWLWLSNCTIRNNPGEGVRIGAGAQSTWIDNSTIHSNGGTGIYADAGPVYIRNCTVALNQRYGIFAHQTLSEVNLYNSAVVDNTYDGAPYEIQGPLHLAFNNLISDVAHTGGIAHGIDGNIVGIEGAGTIPYADVLEPLSLENGGTTMTAAPVPGSRLLQAGAAEYMPLDYLDLDGDGDTEEPAPCDQRGPGFPRVWASYVSIGAVDAPIWRDSMEEVYVAAAEDLVIEMDAGEPGLGFGDTVGLGEVSGLVFGMDAVTTLVEALDAVAPGGTIYLPAGRFLPGETIVVDKDFTLIGTGARETVIDGSGEHRIFDVPGNYSIDFHHLTLTGGRSPEDDPGGDALRIAAGAEVRMGYCEITGSLGESAVSAAGRFRFLSGAIRDNAGTAIRADTTSGGRVWFDNSTMTGNHGTGAAGGIQFSGGQVWVRNSTIVLNSASSGSLAAGIVRAGSGRLSLYNSVVAGNRIGETPADIGGEVYNSFIQSSLIADPASSGGIVHGEQGNVVGLDGLELIPYSDLLGAPSYSYGGSTLAAAPVPGSPLLGAGNPDLLPPDNLDFDSDSDTNEGIPSDQRGAEYPRLSPEETVSIGAVEGNLWSGRAPSTVYVAEEDDFLIEIDPDGDGLSIGDRVTWLSVNQGTVSGLVYGVDALASLKEAVEEAVATAGTVRIAAGTYTSDQYIMIQRDLTLIGDGAQHTILDQKRKNNALWVRSSAVATIRHLTITNADHPFEHISGTAVAVGGGAKAILAFCEITNSGRQGVPGVGSHGSLWMSNCTVRNNLGAGVRIWSGGGTTSINNSTIHSNGGSGIHADGGPVEIRNSTIALNRTYGIFAHYSLSEVNLYNSAVVGNARQGPSYGVPGSFHLAYNNLIDDAAHPGGIAHGVNGNIVGINGSGKIPHAALLGPLSLENGGTTMTAAPVPGSLLLRGGSVDYLPTDRTDVDGDGDTEELAPWDQRGEGFPRVLDGIVSIGAVQPSSAAWRYGLAQHGEAGPILGSRRYVSGGATPPFDGPAHENVDGVVFLHIPPPGGIGLVKVVASEAGFLDAWIDVGMDGVFGPEDKIGGGPSIPVVAGEQIIPIDFTGFDRIPGLDWKTYARFRISSAGGLGPDDDAPDGEVEDYGVTIPPLKDELYVAGEEQWEITTELGGAGLSLYNEVTWRSETQGEVSGLVFGVNAFTSLESALDAAIPGKTIRIAAGRYVLEETLVIEKDLTLVGEGAQTTLLDGNRKRRIVDVPGDHEVHFRSLTLTGGLSPEDDPGGAALRVSEGAHVTFAYCEIADSEGESAIKTAGRIRILNSTIRGNHGTAIWADATAAGRVWFDNSTIVGNHATGAAAGIQFTDGQVWIRNSSLVLNTADGSDAAGIVRTGSGQLHLRNSVVAGNTVGGTPADIAGDVYNSNRIRHSLVGDAASSGGIPDGASGNIVGIDGIGTIPYADLLGQPSYSYGGPTMTVAPVPGSLLLAAGSTEQLPSDAVDLNGNGDTTEAVPYDQRGPGFPRLSGGSVSIGAINTAATDLRVARVLVLTGPEAMKGLETGAEFVLSVYDPYGNPAPLATNTTFAITTTSTGDARLNGAESLPATVEIEAGQSSAIFTYSDTEAGTHAVTATWSSGEESLEGATADHTIAGLAAPILAGMEATARNYTVHGFSVAVTDALTVSASRSKLTGATVWIGSNFTEGEDVLNVTATAEIAGEFDGETGVLTLSGTSARANYEAVLRSVTYMNTSSDPNPAIRTIHFQVDDGDSIDNLSNIATREIAINRHPIAKDDVLERYPGMPTKVRVADLLANDFDPDGDALTLSGLGEAFNGGVVQLVGDWVCYTPPAGRDNPDGFVYVLEDGRGGTATGFVEVVLKDPGEEDPAVNRVSLKAMPDGRMHLVFAGIPGWTYTIQYMDPNGEDREWRVLGTATADQFGRYEWTDDPPSDVTVRLYRAVYP